MSEQALVFGTTHSLVGILTEPQEVQPAADLPAVILLNAGLIHRVGPNRLYVKIARRLAGLGFTVLRIDLSGIGDSAVRPDHLPFHRSAILETREAMDHLEAIRGIDRFLLMGLCGGGDVSFHTACCDPRVVGAVLINARRHLHDSTREALHASIRNRALARHYWRLALFSSFGARNVLRALRGAVDGRNILPLMVAAPVRWLRGRGSAESPEATHVEDLPRLAGRGVRLLHVYAEGDEGLDYLHTMLGRRLRDWQRRGLFELEIIPGANHTFTLLWSQEALVDRIQNWLGTVVRAPSPGQGAVEP
jgi:pimeloyl-ACP methyl ester carboxylesterase